MGSTKLLDFHLIGLGFFILLLNGKKAQAYNIGNPDCCLSIMDLAIRLRDLFCEKELKIIKKTL